MLLTFSSLLKSVNPVDEVHGFLLFYIQDHTILWGFQQPSACSNVLD